MDVADTNEALVALLTENEATNARQRGIPLDPIQSLTGHLREDLAARDYSGALGLFGSHVRGEALVILGESLPDNELRAVLADNWNSCDAASSGTVGLRTLALFRRAGYTTDTPDRQFTEPTVVYRGNLGEDPDLGWSWTLSEEKAEWFADYALGGRGRFLGLRRADGDHGLAEPTVWRATVTPDAILGYFSDRGEDEVVVEPDCVQHSTRRGR